MNPAAVPSRNRAAKALWDAWREVAGKLQVKKITKLYIQEKTYDLSSLHGGSHELSLTSGVFVGQVLECFRRWPHRSSVDSQPGLARALSGARQGGWGSVASGSISQKPFRHLVH